MARTTTTTTNLYLQRAFKRNRQHLQRAAFEHQKRYVQIAFNHTKSEVWRILPQLPPDPRIIIEAGTPYCKFEGIDGVRFIRSIWRGLIVADLKVTDGAREEVAFAVRAGANAVTAMGSAPVETLDFFCKTCEQSGVYSMIDMLGVIDPLRKLLPMKYKPKFVVIHKGRDEESSKRKMIRFKDIKKIKSKFDAFISIAGGLVPEKVRSAYFNGGDVAILNIVKRYDPNQGLPETSDFKTLIPQVLMDVGK